MKVTYILGGYPAIQPIQQCQRTKLCEAGVLYCIETFI